MGETEMVERVARAMADSEGDFVRGEWGEATERRWCAKARIAIEAMREPTHKMICSGLPAMTNPDEVVRRWQAMIDAALGGSDDAG